jgi:deoxyribodipyrimidine photo-lyase
MRPIHGRTSTPANSSVPPPRMIRHWNAAQREMVARGFMHNTMRMYWGKKILEWSASPEEAFETMLELNNAYELDGRDANSWTGVAWCLGLHDRPWGERPIYGVIRCMMASGLDRKYDMPAYVARVESSRSSFSIPPSKSKSGSVSKSRKGKGFRSRLR